MRPLLGFAYRMLARFLKSSTPSRTPLVRAIYAVSNPEKLSHLVPPA